MPVLEPFDRSRCYRHLGYGNGGGIPVPDLAALESAMNTLRDEYQSIYVHQVLDRCDDAFNLCYPGRGLTEQELISGDTNRSVIRSVDRAKAQKISWADYLMEVDNLAQELYVPNYRDEEVKRYRYERAGGVTIAAIPGPSDTTVGSSIYIYSRGMVGFGLAAF